MTILFTKARELMEKDYHEQAGTLQQAKHLPKAKRQFSNVFKKKRKK